MAAEQGQLVLSVIQLIICHCFNNLSQQSGESFYYITFSIVRKQDTDFANLHCTDLIRLK